MFSLHSFHFSLEGKELYQKIEALRGDALRISNIKKNLTPDQQKFLSDTIALFHLREKAKDKFTRAGDMFFTERGYQQSTSERVSRYKSMLFPHIQSPLFLCAGIGGEALEWALCTTVNRITCVDSDPEVLDCLLQNARVYGVEKKVHVVVADVETFLETQGVQHYDQVIIDPDRRPGNVRMLSYSQMQPPYEVFFPSIQKLNVPVLLKLSPALPKSEIEVLSQHWALMCIEEQGVVKELLALFDPEQKEYPTGYRASVIIGKHAIQTYEIKEKPYPHYVEDVTQLTHVYSPPGSLTRIDGHFQFAEESGCLFLDEGNILLAAKQSLLNFLHPDYSQFEILGVVPFSKKHVKEGLDQFGITHAELHLVHVSFGIHEIHRILPKFPEYGPEALFFTTVHGTTMVFFTRKLI